MRKACAGLMILALAAFAIPAHAADVQDVQRPSTEARVPNFLGSTGLLELPSAYVQPNRQVSAFVGGTNKFVIGGVIGGIADRLEVGVGVAGGNGGDFGSDVNVLVNAKYQVLREKRNLPAIAVGVVDAADQLGLDPSWYVVASKYFTKSEIEQRFALKGHVGYGGGLYGDSPFGGAELFFDRHLSAMAEYRDGDINVGGRYTYKAFTATIALFDLNSIGGEVAYSFRFR